MNHNSSEKRFEEARKRLSESFDVLEKTIKKKISDSIEQEKLVHISDEDSEAYEAKIMQQETTIENLSEEVNRLQDQLSETGNEIEFLNEKSAVLTRRVEKIRYQQSELVEAIESDILRIETLINDDEEEESK